MKSSTFSAKNFSKLAILTIAANIGVVPLLIPTVAYAKPDKNKAKIGDITIAGVVTRDTAGNDFYVRADNGDRFLVVTANQPDGVETGVRVKVTGYYDGNQISASAVGILTNAVQDDNGFNNNREGILDVNGVVTSDPAGDDFYVLGDNGRTYLVITKSQPRDVKTGARVHINGWFDGSHLNANDVNVIRSNSSFERDLYGYNQSGRQITITGVVTRDTPGNDFYVRSDDGNNYLVMTLKQPRKIETGVRVRVKGWNSGDRISADKDDIEVLNYSSWNGQTQQGYLDVRGIVTKDPKGDDFFIRSDDDQIYMVITKSQGKNIKQGARVRVKGWFDGDHLNANDVDVLEKADSGSSNSGMGLYGSSSLMGKPRYLTIVGKVSQLGKGGNFYVKDGIGLTYLVASFGRPDDLEVGEKVQVFGYYNNGTLASNKKSIKVLG